MRSVLLSFLDDHHSAAASDRQTVKSSEPNSQANDGIHD
jgi:hypothetical protein